MTCGDCGVESCLKNIIDFEDTAQRIALEQVCATNKVAARLADLVDGIGDLLGVAYRHTGEVDR